MTLSVIIIAKNAEATIRRCLESVAWADEIVVVESGSDDRTADVCRELGAKVHQAPDWPAWRCFCISSGDSGVSPRGSRLPWRRTSRAVWS